jgi:hypothetical protein
LFFKIFCADPDRTLGVAIRWRKKSGTCAYEGYRPSFGAVKKLIYRFILSELAFLTERKPVSDLILTATRLQL